MQVAFSLGSRDNGNTRRRHRRSSNSFVAHGRDRAWPGADKHQSSILHRLREIIPFGQKAVSRMHRTGTSLLGDFDNLVAA